MTINFACLLCGKKIKAPNSAAGRKVLCPGCNGKITVPGERQKPPVIEEPVKEEANSEFDQYELEEIHSEPISQPAFLPITAPQYSAPTRRSDPLIFELPAFRSYLALTIVRISLIVFAVLAALGWVVSLCFVFIALASASNDAAATAGVVMFGGSYLFVQFIVVGVFCCCAIAASELIKLWIDVQENTLAAAHYCRATYLNR